MKSGVAVVAALRLFELRIYSQRGCEFAGNGLDRSGIDADTAILYEILIGYNIQRS